METILKTYNICKSYKGILACDHINMTINKGDIYGFVGKNGAGKTTLIRLITGLIQKSDGGYELFGVKDYENINAVRSKVSGIVETPSIFMNLSAYDNLLYQATLTGTVDKNKIQNILKMVNLDTTNNKKAKNFSLGMRQRLGIALCLIGEPELIVLDEPMNGLDPQGIIEMRDLLLNLHNNNITILISSHILSELSKIATKYGFIDNGKLIEEITVDELEHKCRNYIQLTFNQDANHNIIMEVIKEMHWEHINNYQYKIFENIDATPLVNLFSDKGIIIKEIKYVDTDVESYFINLIGGLK